MCKPINYCKPDAILLVLMVYRKTVEINAAANFKLPVVNDIVAQPQRIISD